MSDKRQFWFQHIEQWEQSGLSQTEYARQQGLSIKSFGYYRRRYNSKQSLPVSPAVSLLPVNVATDKSVEQSVAQSVKTRGSGITLISSSGFRIELSSDFDPVALQSVLNILEAA